MCGPHGYGWSMGGWWMMALMGLFWLLVLAGIAVLVVWMVNRSQITTTSGQRTDTALDILRQRYARGEIAQDEYERMKNQLS